MAQRPVQRRPWSAEDEAKLMQLRASGWSWPEIAQELGRTITSVEVRSAEINRKKSGSGKSQGTK